MLAHVNRDCTVFASGEIMKKEMVYNYGPWLRASPLKRNRLLNEEHDKEMTTSNKLQRNEEDGTDRVVVVRDGARVVDTPLSKKEDDVHELSPKGREGCEADYNKRKTGTGKRITRQMNGVITLAQQEGGKSFLSHHIEVDVCREDVSTEWRAVGVYGWAKVTNKHLTWSLMRRLCHWSNNPTVLFGDFNEILSMEEKKGGSNEQPRSMEEFRRVIHDCRLRDLGFKGCWFTWQRGNSVTTLIRERLDRYLRNVEWCSLFPNIEVVDLHIHNSDHAPIILKKMTGDRRAVKNRLPRFKSLWLS
ncbi:Mitochondrial distribution and morphology protein 12 [Bienertia sinuspersici]